MIGLCSCCFVAHCQCAHMHCHALCFEAVEFEFESNHVYARCSVRCACSKESTAAQRGGRYSSSEVCQRDIPSPQPWPGRVAHGHRRGHALLSVYIQVFDQTFRTNNNMSVNYVLDYTACRCLLRKHHQGYLHLPPWNKSIVALVQRHSILSSPTQC